MYQSRDITVYGYGSIAWKNRVENWKRRRHNMQQKTGVGGCTFEEDEVDFDEGDANAQM